MSRLNELIATLNRPEVLNTLVGMRRGMEKEALRITPDGRLAQTSHPAALGSALTHPLITTDFSEALLELITPPHASIDAMLEHMAEIHGFVCRQLNDQNEMLWASSMPCVLEGDAHIPIARYGASNVAQMKSVYRQGLGHRYGRSMQAIAGIHYNLSFPDDFFKQLQSIEHNNQPLVDYKSAKYFSLIRNFRRYFWLLLYLFGAAPAVCPTFVRNRVHQLDALNKKSLYRPCATSLRMGDLGYQSKVQENLYVDYNSIESYVRTLLTGLTTSHPVYEAIGLKDESGYKQLNTNLLQIENEFYSVIRPKTVTHAKEAPLQALKTRGVEYVEVRSVDVNLYEPVGMDIEQAHFMEAFLLFCLLQESPPTSPDEYRHILHNQHRVVNEGRDPMTQVYCHGELVPLRDCAHHWLGKITACAELLGQGLADDRYPAAVPAQYRKVANPELTPSGRIIQQMKDDDMSFYQLALQQSKMFFDQFLRVPLNNNQVQTYQQLAEKSFEDQQAIEAADAVSFEQYLESYFQQYFK